MTAPSPSAIAANLAALLYLARHRPEGEAELTECARVLHTALAGRDTLVAATPGWLEINGRRLSTSAPGIRDVNEQLIVHSVSQLMLTATAAPGDLLAVCRTLAAYPGAFPDWEALLASLGSHREQIRLTHAGEDLPLIRYQEDAESGVPSDDNLTLHPRLVDDSMIDEGGLILPPIEIQSDSHPEHPIARAAAVRRVEGARLTQLVDAGRSADEANDMIALLDVARDFLDAADATNSEATARMYRLELRRLLSRRHMAQFAKLAAIGKHKELALDVLRRLGSEATEVLMELLVETESLPERRGYFTALTRMDEGTDIIMHHLDHPAWYVVRNAAELCGELHLEKAVPRLALAAGHPDERVRKSIVVALARIGTRDALEPIARLLKDPSSAIRLQVLGHLEGTWGRPLAMSLASLLETEDHPDVVREALRALGRIGTPDAIQALQRAALGENRRLTKRQRLQALEGLGLAGAAAGTILQNLTHDGDPEIAEAAVKALETASA